MFQQAANAHDVGRSLVDAVYRQHGAYQDHLRRLNSPVAGKAPDLMRRMRLEAREGGKLAAYLFQRFALPVFGALRRDLPLAFAATLFAIGFPCGVLALALAVTP